MFTVLPLGLSIACYVFIKLIRPLVRFWQSKGLKAILYSDDGIVSGKGEKKAINTSAEIKTGLENAL